MANFKYYHNNQNQNDNKNVVGDWKRSKDENFNGGSNSRSQIKKNPSLINGQQLSPHQLEERFCATVGGVSWQEVMQNQKYMYQHDKILEWKDSAVEEAFWDAKNRFWQTIHGQPCDIKLPDPDTFIDNVDWNSTIDPNLLEDLENREYDSFDEIDKQDGGVIIGISTTINQSDFTPAGWGDAEEVKPQQEFLERRDVVGNERWFDNGVKKEATSFSNGWEDDCVYVPKNKVRDGENRVVNGPNWNSYRKQRDYGYNKKSDHGGWGTSRYKISRYQHHNYGQPLHNYGVQKGSFSCERPLFTWKPVTRR